MFRAFFHPTQLYPIAILDVNSHRDRVSKRLRLAILFLSHPAIIFEPLRPLSLSFSFQQCNQHFYYAYTSRRSSSSMADSSIHPSTSSQEESFKLLCSNSPRKFGNRPVRSSNADSAVANNFGLIGTANRLVISSD